MNLQKITKTTGGYEVRGLKWTDQNDLITGEVFDNVWKNLHWLPDGNYYINNPHQYDLDLSEATQTKPDHYPNAGKKDVIAFCQSNSLGFIEGNIVKYVTRHKSKNGLEDLHKAKEYLNRLIQTYEKD